ncbi:MAG: helix-turn-helix domain-containing protein [Desulfobacteraceae bacterium]|nr:helix-turn-helix domain-containing protein [Desulfobacteraceae bacterium]
MSGAGPLEVDALPAGVANYNPSNGSAARLASLADMEKAHIQEVILHTGSLEEAARVLGIDPATLWRKRKRYQLD